LGFEVCDFSRDVLGVDLLPWQEWLFIHGLELKPDGAFRFRTVLVLVARQNGKTTALMVLALWRLVLDAAELVLGTSTNLDYARESWQKACGLAWGPPGAKAFQGVPELEGEFVKPREANGEQTLSTVGGGRYKIGTATRKGGRSLSVDLLILDELREHRTWDAWSASSKTTNARARGQRWALSNMGDDGSVVLNHLRAQALATLASGEGDDSLGLFEWSAPDGCDPGDRSVWPMANPGLGHTISVETIAGDYATDPPEVFLTEDLCIRVPSLGPRPIDVAVWAGLADPGSQVAGPVAVGVDVAPGRDWSSVAVAGRRADGVAHVEVVWQGPVGGLVAEVSRVVAGNDVLQVMDGKQVRPAVVGDVLALKPLAAGFAAMGVVPVLHGPSQLAAGCARLLDASAAAAVRHLGQVQVSEALTAAVKRDVGDGGWAWGKRASAGGVDISCLVALTEAHSALVESLDAAVGLLFSEH
jgi:hypothetical protein